MGKRVEHNPTDKSAGVIFVLFGFLMIGVITYLTVGTDSGKSKIKELQEQVGR